MTSKESLAYKYGASEYRERHNFSQHSFSMGSTGALQKSGMGNTGALQLKAEADDFRAAVVSSAHNDSPYSGSPYAWRMIVRPEDDDSDEEDDASDDSDAIIPDEVYAEQLCLQEALVGSISLNRGINYSDFKAAVLSSAGNNNASDECGEEIVPDEVYAQQLCLQEALVGSISLNSGAAPTSEKKGARQFPLSGVPSTNEKKVESLPALVYGVWSEDKDVQLESTTQIRELLSIERCPPIDRVIQSGVVPRLVQFLQREDFPELQLEAAWALTNIASGTSENTKVVIEHGAIPIFVELLSSPSDDVREQAVWALGNVAGESPKCRDLVLGHGALIPLLCQINEHAKLSMLRNATWTLSNLCKGKPQPSFEQIKPALAALKRLINSIDEEVLTDACWALSYLSDGTNDKIQAVIDVGACRRLVELLRHPSPTVVIPALRTVGNIVTGDDHQTQCIIELQALPSLMNLLKHKKKSIKKEACWTISNITAGNSAQIQAVIAADIIGPLIRMLQTAEFDIKKEAAWAISNVTSGGSHDQIKYLVSQGCIQPLCDLLVSPDAKIVTVCLGGLENILKVGKTMGNTDGVNVYARMIDEAEGLVKIENLKSHDDTEINEKAVNILETYWLEDDDFRAGVLSSARNDKLFASPEATSDDASIISDEVYAQQLCLQEALVGSMSLNKALSSLKIEDEKVPEDNGEEDINSSLYSMKIEDEKVPEANGEEDINSSLSSLKIEDEKVSEDINGEEDDDDYVLVNASDVE